MRGCATRSLKGEAWWSQTGSNRRPHACKARALPAELWPRILLKRPAPVFALRATPGTLHSTIERGCATRSHRRSVVGLGRLELPTSRLSSARSNQLSYKPQAQEACRIHACGRRKRRMQPHKRLAPGACSSAKKEKRRRRNPANGTHPIFRPMAPECF